MNEEFYATIKLVSGEEVFAKVCAFEENDDVLIVLDNPIFIDIGFSNKFNAPLIKVAPWINLTDETTFIVDRSKILIMTEVRDQRYIRIHTKYVREKNKSSNRTQITPNMGYISSIDEARETLEKTYNLNVETKTND